MLQSITDFTIPNSYSHLFYKDPQGKVRTKTYFKASQDGYFINGDVSTNEKGEQGNNIFKVLNPKNLKANL
jgi:hypothetical protein